MAKLRRETTAAGRKQGSRGDLSELIRDRHMRLLSRKAEASRPISKDCWADIHSLLDARLRETNPLSGPEFIGEFIKLAINHCFEPPDLARRVLQKNRPMVNAITKQWAKVAKK